MSNTPLDQVIDCLGCAGKKVYIVNLYPNKKPLPQDLLEVMARRDEIFYAEKIKRDIHLLQLLQTMGEAPRSPSPASSTRAKKASHLPRTTTSHAPRLRHTSARAIGSR